MKKTIKNIIIVLAVILTISCNLYAENLSLGLGYPYVSLKYNFSEKTATEFRYANSLGINICAGRFYWNFKKYDKTSLFTGFEGGYIKFNTLDIKGSGTEIAGFIGGEHFISKQFSLLFDFAPTFISLKDADSNDVKVSGIEFVVNLGLYYRFGK